MVDSWECLRNPKFCFTTEHGQYLQLVDSLLNLYRRVEDTFQGLTIPTGNDRHYKLILIASAPRTTNALLSVVHLCSRGLTEDARIVVRKMLEVMVHVRFIMSDPSKRDLRAQRFLMHGSLKNHRYLEYLNKAPNLFSKYVRMGFKEHEAEMQSAYDSAKGIYPTNTKGEIEKKYFDNWCGIKFRQLLIDLHMHDEIIFYDVASGSTHFSTAGVIDYVDVEQAVIKNGRNPDEIPVLLHKSSWIMGQILEWVDLEFGVGIEKDLAVLADEMADLDSH